ncbi:ABC transporter permease [Eubacteriales bacterium OttesenSCG-928-N13]|nr:ABC transporter permease [Eubacteriales bacterium OttesenSCG-928-N13]
MRRKPNKKGGLLALMPLYLWTLLLVVFPMGYVLVMSFMTKNDQFGVDFILTLGNYIRLSDPSNMNILLNSLKTAVFTTLLTLLLGYPFAFAMSKRKKSQRNLIMLLVIVPFWTSALLRTYGWMLLMRSNGLLNNVLMGLHLTEKPIQFLYNNGAVLFGMTYSLLPFMILPLYSSLEKLDNSLLEASRDLGAGRLRSFLTITLPMTLPGVVSGCMLVFVPSVGLYFISDLMGGGSGMVLGNLISYYLTTGRDWPMGAALSMVMVVLTFLTMGVYRRFASNDSLGVF